jgi:putative ABC transport system substrate-binding protein
MSEPQGSTYRSQFGVQTTGATSVIVAAASPSIGAAQQATTTIPIVMATTGDPVGSGFVKSLARPGGNITGLSSMSGDLGPKLFDLLHSAVPELHRVAVLVTCAPQKCRQMACGSPCGAIRALRVCAHSAVLPDTDYAVAGVTAIEYS